jgi:hypothetical protein
MMDERADDIGAFNVFMASAPGSPVKWVAQQGRLQHGLDETTQGRQDAQPERRRNLRTEGWRISNWLKGHDGKHSKNGDCVRGKPSPAHERQ